MIRHQSGTLISSYLASSSPYKDIHRLSNSIWQLRCLDISRHNLTMQILNRSSSRTILRQKRIQVRIPLPHLDTQEPQKKRYFCICKMQGTKNNHRNFQKISGRILMAAYFGLRMIMIMMMMKGRMSRK